MTKGKGIISTILAILSLNVTQGLVHADSAETAVTVTFKAPTLYIESVTPPRFETYTYSKSENTVHPKSELSIKVVDERDVKSDWQLSYRVTLFEKSNGQTLGQFSFSKGKLLANGKEMASSLYEANSLKSKSSEPNETTIVTVMGATDTHYEYHVAEKDICLDVPAQAEIGHYYSEEVVTLSSVPQSE